MSCLTQSDGLALLTLKLWSVVQGHKWSLKFICESIQGLLELLWTVYSEEELQSCLKLRNFENHFNKDKSVGL